MKNKVVIAIVILVVILGIVFIPKLFHKKNTEVKIQETTVVLKGVDNFDSKIKEAESFEEKGSLLEAKEIYKKLTESPLSSEQMNRVQSNIDNLNVKMILAGANSDTTQIYEVEPGDVLVNIAKKFNATVESIVKANNIKNNLIRPGMKLKVVKGKFSIYVNKSQNILILKLNDEVIKTYTVATGKNNSSPVGTYKIVNKLVDPVWYKDGKAIPASSPDNVLGSRWMGFDLPEYGIHGTTAPELMGMQVTEGCVRMRNPDVEELYSIVPVGTEVTIAD